MKKRTGCPRFRRSTIVTTNVAKAEQSQYIYYVTKADVAKADVAKAIGEATTARP